VETASRESSLTIYSTVWCGYCTRLKRQLEREGVPFVEVDIEDDQEAAAFVEQANRGSQTVPTVRLPDGTTMTNPTLAQLKQRLAQPA
jgi:mycoredoxin